MNALAAEIAETERQIAAVDRVFEDRIESAQKEMMATIRSAASDADAAKSSLRLRLSHLKAAMADGSQIGAPKSMQQLPELTQGRTSRPTARELILRALRDQGPLSTNALDGIVIQQGGWTKAASDKAKLLAKRDGLATNEKRIWSITAQGEEELSKFGP
ncbi:hypothetical protein [Methylobacterium fujisawaense]